jgi:hypothetical protein
MQYLKATLRSSHVGTKNADLDVFLLENLRGRMINNRDIMNRFVILFFNGIEISRCSIIFFTQ